MTKKEREICEFEKICEYLRSKLSNDNIISALRPGLKTGMEFRGLVWKRVWKITFFGLKSGQDLENREAHPHQEFQECPPGSELRKATTSTSVTFIGEYPPPPRASFMARLIMKEGYSVPSGLRFGFHDTQVL